VSLGAGKSTLFGMLTGLVPPSKGDCIIGGSSMVEDTFSARQSIGFCPQENILFDRLTVFEHIELFFRLKGMRSTRSVIKLHAEEVGLSEFLHIRSHALSGGNKRKLCLAMALAGDHRQTLLIFDEPTSGMGKTLCMKRERLFVCSPEVNTKNCLSSTLLDPSSRRACWECLRRKRVGRVVVLVSHTMSEADLLADR
jgi:ATP-binding cassette subfamily A (ABC1) protein 3